MSKIDTIEKLAQMMSESFSDVENRFDAIDARFDGVDARFDKLETEIQLIKRILDRIDTRLAALELAVFGASNEDGGRLTTDSILARLTQLEHAVFQKQQNGKF